MRTNITYSILIALLWLTGCSDNDLYRRGELTPDGKVRMTLNLALPLSGGSVVTTRATEPSATEKVVSGDTYVLVLDGISNEAVLKQKPAKVTAVDTDACTVTVDLFQESETSYLCLLANVTTLHQTYLNGVTAGITLEEIKEALTLPSPETGISGNLPMSGFSGAISEITTATSNLSVPLTRSVARIDVSVANDADFTIEAARLVNAPIKGWLIPQASVPVWDETEVITYDEVESQTSTSLTERIYCYESDGVRKGSTVVPTRIVVKGSRGSANASYYGFDILHGQDEEFNIERNKIYTLQLNKIQKDGYQSFEEAARSPAFNAEVDMDIKVTDPYAHDITTNGKQYLGVTNAEFVVYPMKGNTELTHLHVATLTYTTDPNWMNGTLTLPDGLTFVTGTGSKLEINNYGQPVYRDILVNASADFTSGIIVAHIGNLRKEIRVTVKSPMPAIGGMLSDYGAAPQKAENFVVGEIIAPSKSTAWVKVSEYPVNLGPSALNDKAINPDGGIYIHVESNLSFSGSALPRQASLYIAGPEDNQRIKVFIHQDIIDVYSGKNQIEPFSYVGTYHRWNQTGERLIRIDATRHLSTFTKGVWWRATVAAGQDFIILSTDVSKDSGINCINNPYGVGDAPNYADDDAIEAYCQVDGELREVEGTGANIYFKMGLTSKLSSANAQPRYGLIAITYGEIGSTLSSVHLIYVRQGEAADYLMRPSDPSLNGKTWKTDGTIINRSSEFLSPKRPQAVKFGVYNLTDPQKATGQWINRGVRGYGFTRYPSQGGYLYRSWNTIALSHPDAINDVKTGSNSQSGPWNASRMEVCPVGYRMPGDGVDREYYDGEDNFYKSGNSGPKWNDNDIIDSEVRQSLWLYPLKGGFRSDFSNQIRGYLADGFFDRRPIVLLNLSTTGSDYKNVAVAYGSTEAAFWGYLIYNPYNYASIFAPLCGSIATISGKNIIPGKDGYFITTRAGTEPGTGNATLQWGIGFGFYTNFQSRQRDWTWFTHSTGYVFDSYKLDNMSAYSVRCIKDEQKPIDNESVTVHPIDPGAASISIRHTLLAVPGSSLQQQIENEYSDLDFRKNINSIVISGSTLQPADYDYLNEWADKTDHNLRHIMIRGVNNKVIPGNAFTSNRWSSITLTDANVIEPNAFSANALSGLKNLKFAWLDKITIKDGAFGSFTSLNVQVFLDGEEWDKADKTQRTWKDIVWGGIKKY